MQNQTVPSKAGNMKTPIITLTCAYTICAGHRLSRDDWSQDQNKHAFGKCTNSHGHHYRLEVILSGPMSLETGMLINGFDVDAIVKPVVFDVMDHHFLNDDIPFFKTHQPTAEWIAVWAFDALKESFPNGVTLKKIRVYETPDLAAEYPA